MQIKSPEIYMVAVRGFGNRLIAIAGLVFLSCFAVGCGKMQVCLDSETGQYVIIDDGKKVLQYNYATVEPDDEYLKEVKPDSRMYAVGRSNYIHPLFGPDGQELTLDWSKDHPHHRGIYWAWPEVQYHGETADLHALQNIFARPTGKVESYCTNNYAEISAENKWMWHDKTPIVIENVTIRVNKASKDGRYIDLNLEFKALVDSVTIARRDTDTYGGLNIRLAPVKDMKFDHYADDADAAQSPAWQGVTGIWNPSEKPTVLAVFEKADNQDYPGDYIEYPYLPWFQPTFPKKQKRYELKKDEPLVLQYRFWIASMDRPSDRQYRQQWQIYQKTNMK